MKRSRAYYRHQRKRYLAHAEYIVRYIWRFGDKRYFPEEDNNIKRLAYKLEGHRPCCSCHMCSPSRKYQGISEQEKRQPQMYEDIEDD